MTTLADEIARAAVTIARGNAAGALTYVPASPAALEWVHGHRDEWWAALDHARRHLDATMPLQAPRKPQAPEGGMMGEFW